MPATIEDRPKNLPDFEDWLEACFEKLFAISEISLHAGDEWTQSDLAELVDEAFSYATFFNFQEFIPCQPRRKATEAMQIIGRMIAWVRDESLRISPYFNAKQAARYLGLRSEKQIYGAIERGKLTGSKFGKELRLTKQNLDEGVR